MKIYVIEDDKKLANQIANQLQKYQYEIIVPADFKEIMTTFRNEESQLVLMDINLPYFDGFYWCQKIRSDSKVPILFLSARDSNMDQVMALEYGADDYMVKPFAAEVLVAKVSPYLW